MNQLDKSIIIRIITWIIRLATGVLFVFSGFTKGIDPWGTLYQIDAYLAAMNLNLWSNLRLALAFGLSATEFVIGVFLLTGTLRKATPIAAIVIMAFMLPLSAWVAFYNPVEDCGCFGSALIISNQATLIKNIILCVLLLWLLKYNSKCICLISPAIQWIFLVLSIAFIFMVEMFGYNYQPLIDFGNYKKGTSLLPFEEEDGSEEYILIYSNGENEHRFSLEDELPDEESGWFFVKREKIDKYKDTKSTKEIKNLIVFSRDGSEIETTDIIENEGKEIIVMMPELRNVSPATTWKLNALYDLLENNDIKMIAIASGNSEDIDFWKDIAMPSYEIFLADDTLIKEIIRGNPAIVFLENGVIRGKTMLSAIDSDVLDNEDEDKIESYLDFDNDKVLINSIAFYLIITGLLMALSLIPRLYQLIPSVKTDKDNSSIKNFEKNDIQS